MIIYQLVRGLARITMFFFFRKVTVTTEEEIPPGTSVIFAPNHQSAFLDPIVIAVNTRRSPWFLTRASVFKGGLVKRLLKVLHMIPVFRPRDMVDLKTANNPTFDFCQELLLDGKSILIFPEGNHGMQKRLRTPLKKGIGRIALRAAIALKDDPAKDVVIVPVGINYEHPTRLRTDLLLKFGKPISLKHLVVDKDKPEAADLKALREDLALHLQELMIDIRPKKHYNELEYAWQTQRTPSPNLVQRFEEDKQIIASLSSPEDGRPRKEQENKNSILRTILLILGFPFWLLGVLLNLGWIIATKLILKYVVKDPHFIHSMKFICVMVGVPVFTLITATVLQFFTGWFWPFVILVPLSGLLAYEYQARIWRTPQPVLIKDLAGDALPDD